MFSRGFPLKPLDNANSNLKGKKQNEAGAARVGDFGSFLDRKVTGLWSPLGSGFRS